MCGGCANPVAGAVRAVFAPSPPTLAGERREVCEGCSTRVVAMGVSYCGTPFVGGVLRADQCGCIIALKVRDSLAVCPQGRWLK